MLQEDLTLFELFSSLDSSVGEVNFQVRRLHKTELAPDEFTDTTSALKNLEFLKFNRTAFHTWASSKSINRPEKVASLTYHYSHIQYPGVTIRYIPAEVGEFRCRRKEETFWEIDIAGITVLRMWTTVLGTDGRKETMLWKRRGCGMIWRRSWCTESSRW